MGRRQDVQSIDRTYGVRGRATERRLNMWRRGGRVREIQGADKTYGTQTRCTERRQDVRSAGEGYGAQAQHVEVWVREAEVSKL